MKRIVTPEKELRFIYKIMAYYILIFVLILILYGQDMYPDGIIGNIGGYLGIIGLVVGRTKLW